MNPLLGSDALAHMASPAAYLVYSDPWYVIWWPVGESLRGPMLPSGAVFPDSLRGESATD